MAFKVKTRGLRLEGVMTSQPAIVRSCVALCSLTALAKLDLVGQFLNIEVRACLTGRLTRPRQLVRMPWNMYKSLKNSLIDSRGFDKRAKKIDGLLS
ncbi:hypothetical protein DM02DRAFT_400462 [Periconia macrospinosa]|uniref:Uncharacterized protein n=1 Tax=Periconia macrospinosa TaxID=97972 RepID=A0A2V1DQC9_9PLEO|nr:hypothetical protein DM02DRAFT_400462 [Periconia macrospinosa]